VQLRALVERILAGELQLAAKSVADCSAALLEHEAREEVFVKVLADSEPE
jgi:hypothetical protein